MSSVSIRAPKRKPVVKAVPNRVSTPTGVVKKEPVEVAVDQRKWTSYTLRSNVPRPEAQDVRHNILRFQSTKVIDPAKDFARPIHLARKDVHEAPVDPTAVIPQPTTDEKQEFSVAPHGGPSQTRKPFSKKTYDSVPQDDAARVLRQEERHPWILEDFDGKNVYQGTLEGGQANTYVFLKLSADGFDVIPVSKFYRFASRARYTTLSLDEAEEKMSKRKTLPRWFMKSSIAASEPVSGTQPPSDAQRQYRMKTTSAQSRGQVKAEEQEEELDYNEDFADDEEQHALVDNEEDNKELEERIKKEMLSANAIGDADPELENAADQTEKARLDKEGRRLQRFLGRLEKNNMYESDSDSNPYGDSSSDSEDQAAAKTSGNTSVKGDEEDKKKSADRIRDDKIREQVNKLQNTSVTTYNTPTGSALPSRTHSSSNLNNAKAHAKARRHRPYLVTLKLPSSVLSRFSDIPSSAAGDRKRRAVDGYDSDRSQKKVRILQNSNLSRPVSPNPSRSPSNSRLGSRASSPSPADNIITASELANIVRSSTDGITMKGLLKAVRPKIDREPKNKGLLVGLLKEAGIAMVDGKLSIRS